MCCRIKVVTLVAVMMGLLGVERARAEPASGQTGGARVSTRLVEEPRILGEAPVYLERALASAQLTAVRWLRQRPACRMLFAELGADGLRTLGWSLYVPVPAGREGMICRSRLAGRSATAMPRVGSSVTWICPRGFVRLTPYGAAVTLIHEALHHAGLEERPPEPGAMTSAQINKLVFRRCAQ